MKTTRQDIGVYKTDTEFCLFIDNIGNDSDTNIDDVIIRVDVPAGVVYSGTDNLEQGSYDSGSSIWNVGTLIKNTTIQGTICFKVTDPTAAPYSFTFTIETPDGCSGCNDDLQFCIIADGMSCADVQSCVIVNYSTTEQDTGIKDIDGKAIYQRTWYFANDNGGIDTLTGLTPNSITRMVDVENSYVNSDGHPRVSSNRPSPGATGDDPYTIGLLINGTDHYITVWYTKA